MIKLNNEVQQKITELNERIQKEWSKKRLQYVVDKESTTFLDTFMKHIVIEDVHYSCDLESDEYEDAKLKRFILKLSWFGQEIDYGKVELKRSYDDYSFSEWSVDITHSSLADFEGYPLSSEELPYEPCEEGKFSLTEEDEDILRMFLNEESLQLEHVMENISELKRLNVLGRIVEENPNTPLSLEYGKLYLQLNNGGKLHVNYDFSDFES